MKLVPLTRGLCDKVAKKAWQKDGEPDGHEPTEANFDTYRDNARTILEALVDLGYGITATTEHAGLAKLADAIDDSLKAISTRLTSPEAAAFGRTSGTLRRLERESGSSA